MRSPESKTESIYQEEIGDLKLEFCSRIECGLNVGGVDLTMRVIYFVLDDQPKRDRGSWRVIKRLSAEFVKATHQGGWELWHKRAF